MQNVRQQILKYCNAREVATLKDLENARDRWNHTDTEIYSRLLLMAIDYKNWFSEHTLVTVEELTELLDQATILCGKKTNEEIAQYLYDSLFCLLVVEEE